MAARFAIALVAGLTASACASAPPVRVPDYPPVTRPIHPQPAIERTRLADQGPFLPDHELRLCSRGIANPPQTDRNLVVIDHKPLIVVQGTVLATIPVSDACMSSGFGMRNGRPHEGIDVATPGPTPIYSAGPGLIVEVGVASGYGNHIVIDHGGGVFTRYAHLKYAYDGIEPGLIIGFGQPIGLMGDSGNSTGVHLHYEVLVGAWGPSRSFGLTPTDPLSWPAYVPEPVS